VKKGGHWSPFFHVKKTNIEFVRKSRKDAPRGASLYNDKEHTFPDRLNKFDYLSNHLTTEYSNLKL